jgi:hypothetical protein
MTFSTRHALLPLVTVFAIGASFQLTGCGSEEEEVAPTPVRVQTGPRYSAQDLPMDLKVQFPEKYTPMSEELGQAIADFASALASGDHQAFGDMLAPDHRFFHDILGESGEWDEVTSEIRTVRIVNLEDGESLAKVAIAHGSESSASLTAWEARRVDGSTWQFSPLGVAPRTTTRVAMLDDTPFDEDALYLSNRQISPSGSEDGGEDADSGDDSDTDGDDFTPPPSSPSSPSTPATPSTPFGG